MALLLHKLGTNLHIRLSEIIVISIFYQYLLTGGKNREEVTVLSAPERDRNSSGPRDRLFAMITTMPGRPRPSGIRPPFKLSPPLSLISVVMDVLGRENLKARAPPLPSSSREILTVILTLFSKTGKTKWWGGGVLFSPPPLPPFAKFK